MLQALARVVAGRRSKWVVVGLWVVAVVVCAPIAGKLTQKTDDRFVKLIPDSSQSAEVADLLADRFPQGETTIALLVYRRPAGLTDADRAKIARDARAILDVPLVLRPRGSGAQAQRIGPIPPVGPGANPQFNARNGQVAFTLVPLRTESQEEVSASIEELRERIGEGGQGLTINVTGQGPLESDLNHAIESADAALLIATGLLVLFLLMLIYRAPVVALLPLIGVALAYQVAAAIVTGLADAGMQVTNTARSLLLILMFGAGTDYCLLLVARYVEELRNTDDPHEAMVKALPRAAPAIIASGLTVMAALLVLLVCELRLNQTFGPTNAIGIGMGLIASLTLVPALLTIVGRKGFWPSQGLITPKAEREYEPIRPDLPREYQHPAIRQREGVWQKLGVRVLKRPWPALFGVVALLGVGAIGLTQYKEENNILGAFREPADSTEGFEALRSGFPPGALAPNAVLIERTGGPVTEQDVREVTGRIRAVPDSGQVQPVARSEDGRIAQLAMTFPDDPYENAALERVADIRQALDDLGPGVRALVGEGSAVQLDYRDSGQRDLRIVVPLVLGLIFLILCALLRAVVAPLYLIASVVLSFFSVVGVCVVLFEALLGEEAVSPTFPTLAFIFLVALGVDYNIFLMDRVREESREHGTRQGMLRGLVATGPVITSAGIILAGTFAVLATLPITILVQLGIAVSLGVLVDTFLVRTVLVPAVTVLIGDKAWWPSKLGRGGGGGSAEEPVSSEQRAGARHAPAAPR